MCTKCTLRPCIQCMQCKQCRQCVQRRHYKYCIHDTMYPVYPLSKLYTWYAWYTLNVYNVYNEWNTYSIHKVQIVHNRYIECVQCTHWMYTISCMQCIVYVDTIQANDAAQQLYTLRLSCHSPNMPRTEFTPRSSDKPTPIWSANGVPPLFRTPPKKENAKKLMRNQLESCKLYTHILKSEYNRFKWIPDGFLDIRDLLCGCL